VIGINAAAEGDGLYDVQLGYSLGVPVRTFISLAEKAGIKPEWLSVEGQNKYCMRSFPLSKKPDLFPPHH
jgi:hypothetical protein